MKYNIYIIRKISLFKCSEFYSSLFLVMCIAKSYTYVYELQIASTHVMYVYHEKDAL